MRQMRTPYSELYLIIFLLGTKTLQPTEPYLSHTRLLWNPAHTCMWNWSRRCRHRFLRSSRDWGGTC